MIFYVPNWDSGGFHTILMQAKRSKILKATQAERQAEYTKNP
jgi:hypothetical protein